MRQHPFKYPMRGCTMNHYTSPVYHKNKSIKWGAGERQED